MTGRLAAATVATTALTLGMVTTAGTPAEGVVDRSLFVTCALLASAVVWWTAHASAPTRAQVVAVALLLRLMAFPLAPGLSDDGYRYVWDGRRAVEAGASPYAEVPSSVSTFAPTLFRRLNSPDYHSVYPPVSQAVFAAGAWLGQGDNRTSWLWIKGLITLAELAGIALLARLVAPAALVLYAWHPLAVIEIAGQGHSEGLLIGALGLLGWARARGRGGDGVALALAAGVKVWPLVLAVPWWRRVQWRERAGLIVALGGLTVPFWIPGAAAGFVTSLRLYAGHFDWYAPLYLGLKAALWPALHESAGRVAASVGAAVWMIVVIGAWAADDRSRRAWQRIGVVSIVGYGLLSPVGHPWHWLLVLAMAPLLHSLPLYWLATMSLLTYLHYVGLAHALPVALWTGWGGGVGALLWTSRQAVLTAILHHRAEGKWRRVAPHVPAGPRLLDLGCGEGFVADAASESTGTSVVLADVVDFRQTSRPLVLVRGDALPVEDGVFHATILSFVLHHAEHPERLLVEAVRVTCGPVVCLESVVRWKWTAPLLQQIDHSVNRLRSGDKMRPARPRWRTVSEWEQLGHRAGLSVLAESPRGWLHPTAVLVITPSVVASRASSHAASA